MAVGVTLPGGRGQIVGASADAVYGEQVRQRANELPKQDGWVMRSCTPSTGWSVYTAATPFLVGIDTHPTIQPMQVRIQVIQLSAGSTWACALFTPEVVGELVTYREVPGTRAVFDGSAIGVKTAQLTGVRLIPAGQPLVSGFWASDNVVGVQVGTLSNADTVHYSAVATAGLASLIYASDVAADWVTNSFPLISYYSTTGSRVF